MLDAGYQAVRQTKTLLLGTVGRSAALPELDVSIKGLPVPQIAEPNELKAGAPVMFTISLKDIDPKFDQVALALLDFDELKAFCVDVRPAASAKPWAIERVFKNAALDPPIQDADPVTVKCFLHVKSDDPKVNKWGATKALDYWFVHGGAP